VEYVILDEGDLMLEMGFKEDVDKILSQVKNKYQSFVFSATVPHWIKDVTDKFLNDVHLIDITTS